MVQKNKELYYRDTGLDSNFLACVKNKEKAFSNLGQHVLAIHGIEGFSKEFYNKAQSAIREGYFDYGGAWEMISEESSVCYDMCYDYLDKCCC